MPSASGGPTTKINALMKVVDNPRASLVSVSSMVETNGRPRAARPCRAFGCGT
jgi:hypothetical protein